MVNHFYIERDHKKFGPFSAAQLKTLGAASRVHSTDLVWREGGEKGVLAAQVTGLHSVVQAEVSSAIIIVPAVGSVQSSQESDQLEGLSNASRTSVVPDGLMLRSIPEQIDDLPNAPAAPEDAPPEENIKAATRAHSADKTKAQAPAPQVRKLRAQARKGAVILSQDGVFVTYKSKCSKCGLEDPTAARMPLRSGPNRASFFCAKCKKTREVEIQGSL